MPASVLMKKQGEPYLFIKLNSNKNNNLEVTAHILSFVLESHSKVEGVL